MGKNQLKVFVPPNRVRPKPKDTEFSEPVWKWLKVAVWVVVAALALNALLWLLSRGF